MKSNLTYLLVAAVLCLMAGAAQAQVQTATASLLVTGKITQTACLISVANVSMGEVPISDFQSSANGSGNYSRDFNITLGGCQMNTLSSASLSFKGTTTGDATILQLTQTAGVAQGFGLRIRGSDPTHTNRNYVNFSSPNSYSYSLASGRATHQFTAQYVATSGTLRPGTANATATVTLTYS